MTYDNIGIIRELTYNSDYKSVNPQFELIKIISLIQIFIYSGHT